MIEFGQRGAQSVLQRLAKRSGDDQADIVDAVKSILNNVEDRGDAALADYALRFEKTNYADTPLCVAPEEIEAAYGHCAPGQIDALRLAAARLWAYHQKQRETGYTIGEEGRLLMQIVRPLKKVGIYAPGGTASYPSSVLMNAIPAKVAGVEEIYLATPAQSGFVSPLILVAAREAGVDKIFRMGGAQAIAAFAYGTQTVPKVDKITGPGNRYVAAAKREVFGKVGIDAIAGPSEVVILADESAQPSFVAADMLAQAEHDTAAAAILVTTSHYLAKAVEAQVQKQCKGALRREIIDASFASYGAIVVLDSMEDCIGFINEIAPEHLEIQMQNGMDLLPRIQNAGGVFIGTYTPEALGDYVAGSNHVLPTNGTARFASPLGVYDYIKRMSVLAFNKAGLYEVTEAILSLAEAEGLPAHGRSAAIRFEEEMGQ